VRCSTKPRSDRRQEAPSELKINASLLTSAATGWRWVLCSLLGVLLFSGLAQPVVANVHSLPPAATHRVDFDTDIRPILEQNCLRCHGPERPKGRLRLDSREPALKGGRSGAVIIPRDSANSLLTQAVVQVDPDTAMPPPGKGERLTDAQVALLRAWIDQGAPWGAGVAEESVFSVTPAVGYTWVEGNTVLFREHSGLREGWRGGLESFRIEGPMDADTRVEVAGRVLTDDYNVELAVRQRDVGAMRFGFEQYRSYDSGTGGYYPLFSQPGFTLDRDLEMDHGRLWFSVELTPPDRPRMVLGAEHRYRRGDEATLQWGAVSEGGLTRNIYPNFKHTDEQVHILTLDLEYERGDWWFSDNVRLEWVERDTHRDNVARLSLDAPASSAVDRVEESWQSFQGANTFRVERKFTDAVRVSAGHLFSRLTADAAFSLDSFNPAGAPVLPPAVQQIRWRSERIVLESKSQVGNVNLLLGPWSGGSLAFGVQGEWTRQNGTLDGFEEMLPAPPFTFSNFVPVRVITELDRAVVDETVVGRFTRLPFTTVFGEVRLRQEDVGQAEDAELLAPFARDTDAKSHSWDVWAGFDTSPFTWLKFGSHYRHYDRSTMYDDGFADGAAGDILGYPTFIKSRDLRTREVASHVTLRPASWLKTKLTHRLVATDTVVAMEPLGVVIPASSQQTGNYDAHVFSLNFMLTPWRRWYWANTISFEDVRSVSGFTGADSVVPYDGDTWSVLSQARFAVSERVELSAGLSYSRADFAQDNVATALPAGVSYDLYAAQAGCSARLTPQLTARLLYAFYQYDEPSAGGLDDYTAHSLFLAMNWQFP
jgi:hypothetical protein